MNKIIKTGLFLLVAGIFTSCEDVFEPQPENNLPLDYITENSEYAERILGNCYNYLPGIPYNEPGTDDAVSNDANNSWRKMATGSWTSSSNPMNRWESCRSAIQYINIFLAWLDKVTWTPSDEQLNKLFADRFYGEAHAFRGIYNYYLLQAHGGEDAQGNLLGVPLVFEPEDASSNFNVPRNSFAECVEAIKKDFEIALENLPDEYGEACYPVMRQKYPGVRDGNIIRAFGPNFIGRISGRIVKAYLSRLTILAASPAFEKSGVTWEEAANAAAKVIDRNGSLMEVPEDGLTWYSDPGIKDYDAGFCPPEVLWREGKGDRNSLEKEHFPPTLFGTGRMNPTQNLVDAFPMDNGYPIDDAVNSGYDPQNPYADRDPRLEKYILFNGGKAGNSNKVINTIATNTDDGINVTNSSTRTGYYMKKHLNQNVNCDPSNNVNQSHYNARMRFTEFLLNYAEAANEAWGPTGTGSNGFSAYDVIKEIRIRAGIGYENGDAYLESCKADKEKMRQLIRNERRIELCFEGFRFYDLRRWKADLTTPAYGVTIENGLYKKVEVESRSFKQYMIYGPIPYSETLKFSNLQQNAGW